MKKTVIMQTLLLLILSCILTGCDPIYPTDKLKVEKIGSISQGSSAEIKIIYPNTGGTVVEGWKDQSIEILSGDDIISVSGLTVTGLKPGTAKIEVKAVTVINDENKSSGHEEKIYSASAEIKVK